nr:hypothetical protein 8 [Bacillaceae bacterium]
MKIDDRIRELILERKNRAIIANSESSRKEFQFLFNFCFQNLDNGAKEIDNNLEKLTQEEVTILNDMLQSVLNLCREEWIGDSNPVEIIDNPKFRKHCSLCDQPNNKWVFNIVNKFSRRKMNVGSTCIDHFPSITLKVGKTRSQLEREAEKKSRLQKITVQIPGIEREVINWNAQLDDFDILIPLKLEEPYVVLGEELKKLFDGFLDGKRDTSVIERIKEILNQRAMMIQEMIKYCDEYRNKKFVATREIVNWLKRRDQISVIEKLKETGYVTVDTAPNIHEKGFIETFISDINNICNQQSLSISILGTDVDHKNFIVEYIINRNSIKLTCPLKNFLTYFSWIVFDGKQVARLDQHNIFKVCNITDKTSLEIVVSELKTLFKGTKYSISVNQTSEFHSNEIDIINKKSDKVYVLNLNNFINEYKTMAFGIKEMNKKDLINDVKDFISKSNHKVYTRKELRELRSAGREFNKREK